MEQPVREVHPLVSLDYRVRVPAMIIVGLVLLSYFWDYPKSIMLWTAIGCPAPMTAEPMRTLRVGLR